MSRSVCISANQEIRAHLRPNTLYVIRIIRVDNSLASLTAKDTENGLAPVPALNVNSTCEILHCCVGMIFHVRHHRCH